MRRARRCASRNAPFGRPASRGEAVYNRSMCSAARRHRGAERSTMPIVRQDAPMPSNLVTSVSPRERRVQCAHPMGLHHVAYTEWGDPANPRVLVCVHGLTRSGRDFDRLATALSDVYRVVCPDVAGRGRSDWLADPGLYGVPQYVADIVTLIARLDVERVDWFGTSMGGLIGLALGGLPGTPIGKMIVNDIGPHIEPAALERIGEYTGLDKRFATEQEGVDYLASLSLPFGPLTPDEWRALNRPLLVQDPDGSWRARYDPRIAVPFKAATPEANAQGEAWLWHSLEAFAGPLLVVRGAQSDLLSRDTVDAMKARGRAVSSVEIAEAGHAPAFVSAEQIAIARQFFVGDAPHAS
ncbi:alpha/beta fold hydrolase [Burkholderia oklahomensis]|nr:alpha/beta hydrolase [Burkholderia oklahomensis]AOI42693.1 alpha/beta hydrolase [Burkholderia oklahomensis EO147]QPS37434.1 alpha/beta hydrolase [Burkholderia oklahomensis]